ncbi:chromosomal replication initiator protein DnaA [Usitatibacter palustris]|uniref:Chromosomal replication initiator protein DnaA n=1 Tax=Usitatibacter palustris TaxID=2732487 RepID=A0A6M4H144_9PROT|nr:chromosomal replication initiator protein DnaA [Usitatibacter palustris]QJR13219.1 Chromosomal replication initiator protein DnaA [Usitatibacter palustris]
MDSLWPSLAAELKRDLSAQQYDTWIKPLRAERHGDQLLLLAPNHHVLRWVRSNLLARIESGAERVAGMGLSVNLQLDEKAPEGEIVMPEPPVTVISSSERAPREEHRLNPSFTFTNFVNGKANQIARAAAIQVAENPGTAYNPLFIYGGTGLGKTHLLQAIGIEVLKRNPKAKVRYSHAEQFVADVVRAYQHKSFDSLKRYYRSLDLFLIDDVQFFVGKTRSQEEFFYTFNALFEAHKQVVISSDSFPKEMTGIEERLISRFGWGLTVAVEPPELEMRVAILLKKAENDGVRVDEEIAFFIAKHIRSNVRELEGAMKRVLAFARFNNQAVTVATAREALKDLLAVISRQVSIENIQKTVADYYKIKVSEMYSKKRYRSIARPRQVAMALSKELTQQSLPEIGEAFGGRDHTTVLHACRKIVELREGDQDFARDYSQLQQILLG